MDVGTIWVFEVKPFKPVRRQKAFSAIVSIFSQYICLQCLFFFFFFNEIQILLIRNDNYQLLQWHECSMGTPPSTN
jgi:hypothetical protein